MAGFAEGTPTVDIQLGGKSYTLGWTWAAKKRVKEYLTPKYVDPANAPKEEQLAAAFWAALDKDARAGLSVDDVEEMINPRNEDVVIQKLGSLFENSEPDPDPNAVPVATETPTTGKKTSTRSQQLESVT